MSPKNWGRTPKSTFMKQFAQKLDKAKTNPVWIKQQIPAHERPPKPLIPQTAYNTTPDSRYNLSLLPQFEPSSSSSTDSSLPDLTTNAFITTYEPICRKAAIAHLSSLFSIPSSVPPLSSELTAQILTHTGSQEAVFGTEPDNGRLAFLGRRLLEMHFQMFMLQAKTDRAARAGDKALARENEREVDPEKLMARVLEHRHLGKVMESKWNLDPFSTVDKSKKARDAVAYGHAAVRGSIVESIIGGLSHAYGAPVTNRLFYLDILPSIKSDMPEWTHDHIDGQRERVLRQGGLWGSSEESSSGSSRRVESAELEVEQRV